MLLELLGGVLSTAIGAKGSNREWSSCSAIFEVDVRSESIRFSSKQIDLTHTSTIVNKRTEVAFPPQRWLPHRSTEIRMYELVRFLSTLPPLFWKRFASTLGSSTSITKCRIVRTLFQFDPIERTLFRCISEIIVIEMTQTRMQEIGVHSASLVRLRPAAQTSSTLELERGPGQSR